jgi:hypothetical protein
MQVAVSRSTRQARNRKYYKTVGRIPHNAQHKCSKITKPVQNRAQCHHQHATTCKPDAAGWGPGTRTRPRCVLSFRALVFSERAARGCTGGKPQAQMPHAGGCGVPCRLAPGGAQKGRGGQHGLLLACCIWSGERHLRACLILDEVVPRHAGQANSSSIACNAAGPETGLYRAPLGPTSSAPKA